MTRVSVLQLDTRFPRIPGDVACTETYVEPPEIIRISGAYVSEIVRQDPEHLDPAPFIEAARAAVGDIVTTSCGFLAPLEDKIAEDLDRPFLASSLNALPRLIDRYGTGAVSVMTFDAVKLNQSHFPNATWRDIAGVFDVGDESHIYDVIQHDRKDLDPLQAEQELVDRALAHLPPGCKALVLECTNLPPYKRAMRAALNLPIFDILDRLESHAPKTIRADFLFG